MRGVGRAIFAATLLMIVGVINIIYGIGALDGARVFVGDTRFVFTNLNTMGWVLIILGIVQLTGAFSLIAGNAYGRIIGDRRRRLRGDRRPVLDRRQQPVVVAGRLRPVHLHHAGHPRLRRRGRPRAGALTPALSEPPASPGLGLSGEGDGGGVHHPRRSRMSTIRTKLVTAAAVAAAAVGGAAAANAATSGSSSSSSSAASVAKGPHTVDGKSEQALTGDVAAKVRAAALAEGLRHGRPRRDQRRLQRALRGAHHEVRRHPGRGAGLQGLQRDRRQRDGRRPPVARRQDRVKIREEAIKVPSRP